MQTNHGGIRTGAGRPTKEDKKVTVQIMLNPHVANYVNSLGRDKSKEIEKVIIKYMMPVIPRM